MSIGTFNIIVDARRGGVSPFNCSLSGVVETYRSDKDVDKFRSSPNMENWNQQLNFAVWCATAGCGVVNLRVGAEMSPKMKFIASLLCRDRP